MANAQVHEVSFRDLSRAVGCSEHELVIAIHRADSSFAAAGTVAAPAEQVAFASEQQQTSMPVQAAGIDVALVSLAARPGVLDKELPKCLKPIGNQPLIGHVLSQLHAGGIKHFILVIGARGERIRKAVLALPVAQWVTIHFVDLGSSYTSGFARSLLAASPLLGRPDHFLLCTPDHIFDASLVSEMRTAACRAGFDAVALVEESARSLTGALPPTAVRVRLTEMSSAHTWPTKRITQIGTQLLGATAIEAGLYRCSGAFFATLAALCATRDYVTVAEVMQQMAAAGRLGATMTAGRRWLAFETVDQMESTINATVGRDGRARFPWQVRNITADPLDAVIATDNEELPSPCRLVLPLPSNLHDAHAPFVPTPSHEQFDFLCVPSSSAAATAAAHGALSQPLLLELGSPPPSLGHPWYQPGVVWPSVTDPMSVGALSVNAAVGSVSSDLAALSIELRNDGSGGMPDGMPSTRRSAAQLPAYLIELPHRGGTGGAAAPPRSLLALPALPAEQLEPPVVFATPLPQLPPAIDSVALSTSGDTVTLTVHKRVPLAGWMLLVAALITCYSGAPITDLQRAWQPSRGSFAFLHSAWRGCASSLICGLVACVYPSSREQMRAALTWRLSRSTTRLLAASGVAFFANFGAFNLALERTSISHAALFESCSSIYMVVGRLLAAALGYDSCAPAAQIGGVVLGSLGALLTTRDVAASSDAAVGTPISLEGDLLALVSGLGAACYLSVAEAVRVDIDPLAFFPLVMVQFAALCFAAAYFFDEAPPSLAHPFDDQRGVVGWLTPQPARLLVQLWLAIVVDLTGNLGFIAVMKFVPALTVAAVMLLGPLVSTAEGIAVGVDELPGAWTLVGGLLITAGSGLISLAASESTSSVEIRAS